MNDAGITLIIEGSTYHLRAGDRRAIADIPPADRQRLIALLESVKQHEAVAQSAIRKVVSDANKAPGPASAAVQASDPLDRDTIKSGRLGRGDIDNLVARLAIEERQGRKPAPTAQGMYKWIAGIAAIVFLLTLVF